jgi:hypothetical protein
VPGSGNEPARFTDYLKCSQTGKLVHSKERPSKLATGGCAPGRNALARHTSNCLYCRVVMFGCIGLVIVLREIGTVMIRRNVVLRVWKWLKCGSVLEEQIIRAIVALRQAIMTSQKE